jgi:hypothetical protein
MLSLNPYPSRPSKTVETTPMTQWRSASCGFYDDTDKKPMPRSDAFWRTPGQIARRGKDAASEKHEYEVYNKQQGVETRLFAAIIFEYKQFFQLGPLIL